MQVRIVDESDDNRIMEVEDVEINDRLRDIANKNGGLIPVKTEVFDVVERARDMKDRMQVLNDEYREKTGEDFTF